MTNNSRSHFPEECYMTDVKSRTSLKEPNFSFLTLGIRNLVVTRIVFFNLPLRFGPDIRQLAWG